MWFRTRTLHTAVSDARSYALFVWCVADIPAAALARGEIGEDAFAGNYFPPFERTGDESIEYWQSLGDVDYNFSLLLLAQTEAFDRSYVIISDAFPTEQFLIDNNMRVVEQLWFQANANSKVMFFAISRYFELV